MLAPENRSSRCMLAADKAAGAGGCSNSDFSQESRIMAQQAAILEQYSKIALRALSSCIQYALSVLQSNLPSLYDQSQFDCFDLADEFHQISEQISACAKQDSALLGDAIKNIAHALIEHVNDLKDEVESWDESSTEAPGDVEASSRDEEDDDATYLDYPDDAEDDPNGKIGKAPDVEAIVSLRETMHRWLNLISFLSAGFPTADGADGSSKGDDASEVAKGQGLVVALCRAFEVMNTARNLVSVAQLSSDVVSAVNTILAAGDGDGADLWARICDALAPSELSLTQNSEGLCLQFSVKEGDRDWIQARLARLAADVHAQLGSLGVQSEFSCLPNVREGSPVEVVVSLRLCAPGVAGWAAGVVDSFNYASAGRSLKFLFDTNESLYGRPVFVELVGGKLPEMLHISSENGEESANCDRLGLVLDLSARIADACKCRCINLTYPGNVHITPDEPVQTLEVPTESDRRIIIENKAFCENDISSWLGVLSSPLPANVSIDQIVLYPGECVFADKSAAEVKSWIRSVAESKTDGQLSLSAVSIGDQRAVVWFMKDNENEILSLLICSQGSGGLYELATHDLFKWAQAQMVTHVTDCMVAGLELAELSGDIVRDALKGLDIRISDQFCDDLVSAFAHRVIKHPSRGEVAREIVRTFYENQNNLTEERNHTQEPFISPEQENYREWLGERQEPEE